ncbi:sulfotransferase family protein [Solicola gregarius]|uniref:Sulfotransferase domain-containing protein n=1 Tax=Solicola gregarius TaxID=2908642 RepID=A0AA46TLB3_9ACTN|nr:sulfotransferase [Solicola gregarius]UYM06533.1 sulfotransferase domain-containing protein [Solicola gregarius]
MTRHLLVIGAQRSGTTYLQSLLEAHPQIAMARPTRPEPKVFCSDELAANGPDWYRDTYFAHATDERIFGEKSTSYLEDPLAPARVLRTLGGAEIAVMLRDPLQRAVSNWRFSTDNGLETRPLEAALRENLAAPTPWDPASTSVSPFAYVERGRYADYLEPWLEAFPGSSHVWFLDELVGDERAVGALYAELGVDPHPLPDAHERAVNESRQTRPTLPPDLVGRLRAYFSDADLALERLLGRALPWQADEGGAAHG